MSTPHTTPSRAGGQPIRRAVRTSGTAHQSGRPAAPRASGPSLGLRRPAAPSRAERPEYPAHWTTPTWDHERGRWRPIPDDALADWLDGRGAALDDLPYLGEDCTVRHEGSGNPCGFPLLANGMCPNQAEHWMGVRPQSDPRGPISLDEQLANAGNPAAQWRLDREREAAEQAETLDAAVEATAAAAAEQAAQDGTEVGENETTPDLVEAGIRYERARLAAAAAGADQRQHSKVKDEALADLLAGFVESGQAKLSLVMPGSGENRVLTPQAKVWPKLRPLTDPATGEPVLDEDGKAVKPSIAQRIEAIKAAGLGEALLVETIDTTALNEMFGRFASPDDVPEGLRGVYELATEWKMSSTKGGRGAVRTPTHSEVANGRRAGSGE